MKISQLLGPLGAAAYASLVVAFLTGVLKFKFHVKWVNSKWHMWAGVMAVTFATLHLVVYIFTNI